jgi:hypothetical protein
MPDWTQLRRSLVSQRRTVGDVPWGPMAVVLAVTGGILWGLGRTFWCGCGEPVPWSWQVQSRHNSQHLIDPYAFTHVLHGVLLYGALYPLAGRLSESARWMAATLVEAGWEVLENTPMIIERYRATTISLDYYGDSIANSLFDIVACLIGYAITARLRWYSGVALFVIVETVLVLTIRDSLLLNVITLVLPSEAIVEWQSNA